MKMKMLAVLLCLSAACFAQTYTYSTLANLYPMTLISNVIIDGQGNLYGVSEFGGTYGNGTVFKVTSTGAVSALYSFKGGTSDGYLATGTLVRDKKTGNLYGTTQYGGNGTGCFTAGCGIIFKVTPAGKETVLYNFQGGSDGSTPVTGLARDANGNLYGISYQISGVNYTSLVFELSSAKVFSTLTSFNCFIGGNTQIIRNQTGDLFGPTCEDSTTPNGGVWELSPSDALTTLYAFTGGSDGANPVLKLSQDAQGNLYGAAANDGAHGGGVVFKIDTTGVYSVLYSFCTKTNCTDGSNPTGWITLDSSGNLYGVTQNGGSNSNGVVFKLTSAGVESVLYNFTSGQNPTNQETGLVLDSAGNLYASLYGASTIFKLTKH